MNDKKVMKKEFFKNMIFNFIVFTIIFGILGLAIYNIVSSSIYKPADNKLEEMKENINMFTKHNIVDNISVGVPMNSISAPSDSNLTFLERVELNPSLIYLLRDKNGNILNTVGFESLHEYNVNFEKDNIDNVYFTTLSDKYNYRGINYKVKGQNNSSVYLQVLVNIDSEIEILDNFTKSLTFCLFVSIILSAIASYILSRMTLKPIVESWKKQTEFVQNASHELRTPLTIIKSMQELLLESPNSKIVDKFEDINIIIDETNRLSKLIEDLMTLSMSDTNKMNLSKDKIDINELIKEVSQNYIEYATLESKTITLNLNYNKEITVDKNKIHELLIILLDNSIKYTEFGDKIIISVVEKENKCLIEIKDTGIGVDEEDLKYIFNRFYRADKARTRKTGGSGLGLSIASSIVLSHGGNISVEKNKPKGLIISIKLPK